MIRGNVPLCSDSWQIDAGVYPLHVCNGVGLEGGGVEGLQQRAVPGVGVTVVAGDGNKV